MIGLCCEYLSVRFIWLYVVIMSRTRFRVHPHPIVARMSRNSFLETGAKSEVWTDCNGTWTHNYLVRKRILILAKWLSVHLWTKWLWVRGLRLVAVTSNFRFGTFFEQGVPWHSGSYRVWIHYETCTWHDNNIQSMFVMLYSINWPNINVWLSLLCEILGNMCIVIVY